MAIAILIIFDQVQQLWGERDRLAARVVILIVSRLILILFRELPPIQGQPANTTIHIGGPLQRPVFPERDRLAARVVIIIHILGQRLHQLHRLVTVIAYQYRWDLLRVIITVILGQRLHQLHRLITVIVYQYRWDLLRIIIIHILGQRLHQLHRLVTIITYQYRWNLLRIIIIHILGQRLHQFHRPGMFTTSPARPPPPTPDTAIIQSPTTPNPAPLTSTQKPQTMIVSYTIRHSLKSDPSDTWTSL